MAELTVSSKNPAGAKVDALVVGTHTTSDGVAIVGGDLPRPVVAALEDLAPALGITGAPDEVRKVGIAVATELSEELLNGGAPGLHFFTQNRSRATREIYANLHPVRRRA